jgi:hypothetical protein
LVRGAADGVSYGWIVVGVTLLIVLAIWCVGIWWPDMKQWWNYHVNEREHHRTLVRAEEREAARARREARKRGTAVEP